MPLKLFSLPAHPGRYAVSKAPVFARHGAFFLDFCRPLEMVKRFGVITVGLFVPVIHESQLAGKYVIGVDRGEPYFADIPKLWKRHHPTTPAQPKCAYDNLQVAGQFGYHFSAGVEATSPSEVP